MKYQLMSITSPGTECRGPVANNLLRIGEVLGSNLGTETGYHD
jgi:hypothetical protein